jgi:hypothetical protein
MAKHSEGFTVHRDDEGRYVVRTRRGSVLKGEHSEQPLDGRAPPPRPAVAPADHPAAAPAVEQDADPSAA